MTAGNLQWLRDTIGPDYSKRLVSAEAFLVSYRSRKTPAEIAKLRERREEDRGDPGRGAVAGRHRAREDDREGRRRLHPQAPQGDGTGRVLGGRPGSQRHGRPRARPLGGVATRRSSPEPSSGSTPAWTRTATRPTSSGSPTCCVRARPRRPRRSQKAFDTVRAANRAAAAALKPGATGTAVDTAGAQGRSPTRGTRSSSTRRGTRSAFYTHDIGPLLAPAWPDRYGKLGAYVVERDQTFAIEPALEVELPWMMGGVVGLRPRGGLRRHRDRQRAPRDAAGQAHPDSERAVTLPVARRGAPGGGRCCSRSRAAAD